ncbi:SUMF1/EgtB/PvdO family nonheme iron enzyme [Lyngbya confervoides]|uniref:SUMF1/EgtB/PvdO family nonheme iron enzyme n=1 Tax=Lyngbya confervoides BDU141951 TaxID=1574623 RepID=A0ABD4T180_9CYAN|nr:SUMF1/EgtB/PvdO family nonheme iron enzyme [Lyngbya confervoides]MCM1982404.1 SUMF1/EgtB/PvdO family nonheme iron enzyme [Lyngbya confervoides BDU141951]
MRCINCRTSEISASLPTCPVCGVLFEDLYRDLLAPGVTLAGGEYRIEEVLGRGGFGVTYRAYSRGFDSSVAIKEYYPQDYARREGRTGHLIYRTSDYKEPYDRWMNRFKREGRVLFRLIHPNIVRVLNLFEENNTVYLVMTLLEGRTLKDELAIAKAAGSGLSEARVVEIMNVLVSALDEVHRQDPPLYHLDIKPDNVMLTDEGRVVLIDFGAARREQTESSTIARTEDYAPPELMIAGEIGSASDIYELGMVLHEMLAGQLPPGALSRVLGKSKSWEPSLKEPWQSMVSAALRLEISERPRNVSAWWSRYERYTTVQTAHLPSRESIKSEAIKIEEIEEQLDIRQDLWLTSYEMKEGVRKSIELGDGSVVVKIPKGVKSGQLLRLKAKGQFSRRGPERGDLYLKVLERKEESAGKPGLAHQQFRFEVVTLNRDGAIKEGINHTAEAYVERLKTGIELEMVWIPGGRFTMGSPSGELERTDAEGPQHEVNVPGFYLGRYPVTQAQWEAVMGSNPSAFKGANRPVESVSWNDAIAFCEKLSNQRGRAYRLPSEAEWEYACRAGTTTPFYFGATLSPTFANYNGNYSYGSGPKGEYREQTTEVGIFPPNGFGLYDMHGNAWEWCQDRWHDNYNGAPSDGSAWESGSGERRVLRGGSWVYDPGSCRSADRDRNVPGVRYDFYGFRLAMSASRNS